MTGARLRVAVTREGEGAERLATLLDDRGFDAVVVPLIALDGAADGGGALRAGLRGADDGDWLVVTSPNGADAVVDALGSEPLTAGVRVAAVGPTTAERLTAAGIPVAVVPRRFDARSLVDELLATVTTPGRAVLALSALADDTVAHALVGRGWQVERFAAYRTVTRVPDDDEVARLRTCDVVTLASASAATGLAAISTDLPVVCLGRSCAERAGQLGLDVRAVADPSNLEGLVEATALALHPDEESIEP